MDDFPARREPISSMRGFDGGEATMAFEPEAVSTIRLPRPARAE